MIQDHILKRLYVYNSSETPVFLEGLELLILPGNYVNLYELFDETEIENALSLNVALEFGLLEIISPDSLFQYTSYMEAQSQYNDWTDSFFSIFSVGSSSYDVLEPIELTTKLGPRTGQYYVVLRNTGGGRA